ncbi:MAG: hypothetical protein RJA98_2612 [Pseudomonadota bacterium]|jgi:hypothetical protein
MSLVEIVFGVFMVAGVAVFRWLPPAVAAIGVYLAGWLVLPVGHFPAGSAEAVFPYWITGAAVPSDMLLHKAWVSALAAALGALLFDRSAWLRLRPAWADAPLLLWCLWPLCRGVLTGHDLPGAALASLYLLGTWGLPWLLGRVYFATAAGLRLLAQAVALGALACLPFSLLEGTIGPVVYGWFYELHPFRHDGDVRYLGFRPIGFFEHGNQFGLWISLSALLACWLAVTEPARPAQRRWQAVAAVLLLMALAAQSAGGVVLLSLGALAWSAFAWLRPRHGLLGLLAGLLLGGAVYLSGVVPMRHIAQATPLGQKVVDVFRATGRGSFVWRVAQDQKLLAEAKRRPLLGNEQWDWWRARGVRPWGLTMLVLGQYGLVGLAACLALWLWPAGRAGWAAPRASGWRAAALPLMWATVIVLTVADALMNSFIFFPAIIAAGALSQASVGDLKPLRRGEVTRVPARPA